MTEDTYTKDEVRRFVRKIVKPVVTVLFIIIVVAPLFGLFIQFLWNATIADIFGLAAISFWQAVGLFILAKFLFGFGGSSGDGPRRSKHRKTGDKGMPRGEAFRAWWREEGKETWDAWKAERNEGED